MPLFLMYQQYFKIAKENRVLQESLESQKQDLHRRRLALEHTSFSPPCWFSLTQTSIKLFPELGKNPASTLVNSSERLDSNRLDLVLQLSDARLDLHFHFS
eukprot:TRINITY_DN68903_c0_g1_i1.p1 TRINITY_DN68903_c0_g1~~TRINITY_DN68903_c0_g1_i1.p1  ORF type:complete len:101 (+),score=7.97 TRINITY_DN68903_c0_g1_i1:172-474(+)